MRGEGVHSACSRDACANGLHPLHANTKKHAHRIAEVFEEMYPQHVGVAQVVTSTTERVRDGSYGDGLISRFKKNNLARIATSVDMLDTGIDVPEVVNLVFMKPVQSLFRSLAPFTPSQMIASVFWLGNCEAPTALVGVVYGKQ